MNIMKKYNMNYTQEFYTKIQHKYNTKIQYKCILHKISKINYRDKYNTKPLHLMLCYIQENWYRMFHLY